ncbi:Histidinol-phosphate aminotransferase [Anaerohalosphaera lusitana]|uniref:Histidinol-phosphate aminotransferase n=1 Tax=Anaerohalosphaera lusitana TaxID=1936003 RepID=A0A1U9NJD8_9BACT|nr:histidinol-phosphate transaminase [Anaerohalosphaera lusitana]AQT67636.1 Histidinol-phosphate aminotransferase [Anaerohalosphaera lusitana]
MSYVRENIERMKGYTPGFQPEGLDVVKLNTNENPYPPSERVLEAVRGITAEQLRRYPQPLGDKFRIAASGVLGVEPDNIMCTNGGDDLLTIAFRAFCDEKRAVIFPGPTYSLYPVLAHIQDCAAWEVDFDDEELYDNLADANEALTIICNPNAPSGKQIEPAKIGELAERLDGVLLVDEAYADFAEQDCVGLVRELDNVMILRSMSKGYSLAGIRFGYCIASAELIGELLKVKDSYNVDAVAIEAATAAIEDQDYFRSNVMKVVAERQRLTKNLRELGFAVEDSSTNFVLAQISKPSAKDIYEELARRNIFVRYFDLPKLKDKLRVTVGTPEQNDALLGALKDITGNEE